MQGYNGLVKDIKPPKLTLFLNG